ncbi:MAG: hypothetical protein RIA09_16020 [Hoeflea sp.]|uniref:hypothetical protein n=1 Tax=Hoeflea sp. TaxID=1940281 RepID=UPI0032F0757D
MYRNLFGEAKPRDFAELSVALEELEMNPEECTATLEECTDEPIASFNGWTAEIIDNEGTILGTLGWESKENLERDLNSLGIDFTVNG